MRRNARVYVMASSDGMVKIGHSRRPASRRREFGPSVSLVHQTDVLDEAERIERLAHRVLALHGRHVRGEWFEATISDAVKAIEIAVRQAEGNQLSLGGRLRSKSAERRFVLSPVRLLPAMIDEIDAIVAGRIDGADRSSVIREILAEGLAARKGRRT
jgi:hypothetical protein